jgi:hypothetical protein
VPAPFLRLPDPVTMVNARLLTELTDLIKVRPLLDLSKDQTALMKLGFKVDASKCERELGIHYTPTRTAFEGTVAAYVYSSEGKIWMASEREMGNKVAGSLTVDLRSVREQVQKTKAIGNVHPAKPGEGGY